MNGSWWMKTLQFVEHARQHGAWSAVRTAVHRVELAVPVEKDLAALGPPGGEPLVELDLAGFAASRPRWALASREARAARYLRHGCRALALVRDGVVVADVWYVSRASATLPEVHPHLRWFGIELADDDVYLFDLHVVAGARGGGAATAFLGGALRHLGARGFRRAYGYYDARNTPALWLHRVLGFRELPAVTVERFLVHHVVRPARRVRAPHRAA